jgi:hypothetical protein
MNPIDYFAKRFGLDLEQKPPIEILKINRQIMAECLKDLEMNKGAEIGVAQGKHSELLLKTNPDLVLYCVDVWEPYRGYVEYSDRINKYCEEAKARLADYILEYRCHMIKNFSMDAVTSFKDRSLDFVYIDGAHDLKSVVCDIVEWTKKVRIGGIVYGHDYQRRFDSERSIIHVKDAVDSYMYDYGISPWFVLGEGGNNSDGLYKEGVRSWMFIRQEKDRYANQ